MFTSLIFDQEDCDGRLDCEGQRVCDEGQGRSEGLVEGGQKLKGQEEHRVASAMRRSEFESRWFSLDIVKLD